MCKKAVLVLSISKEDNKCAERLLKKVRRFVEVETKVNGRMILEGAQLPLIQTDKNEQYSGMSGVKEFVAVELVRRRGI